MNYFYPDFVCKDDKRILALNESVKNNSDFRCNMQEECFAKCNEGKCSNCILSFRAGEDRADYLKTRARSILLKAKILSFFGIRSK